MSFQMFRAYLRLEQLPDDVKAKHKIKIGAKKPRFDLVKMDGYYPPMDCLKNSKNGQTCFFLNGTEGVINSHIHKAETYLQAKGSLNFSSIYMADQTPINGYLLGYGFPNPSQTYSQKKVSNPFYNYRGDGFLFVIAEDWSTIEILVISNGKYTIESYAAALVSGAFNEALEFFRNTAKPVYQY